MNNDDRKDLLNLHKELAVVSTKCDIILANRLDVVKRMNRIDENIEHIDERLRKVENKQYGILAVSSALGAIFAILYKKFF